MKSTLVQETLCIFCGKVPEIRKKGDHVVPQGLGHFLPEYALDCVCKECDTKHGSKFERVSLRTGFIGLFRITKRIKTNNSKKRKSLKLHNPSLDKCSIAEDSQFQIKRKNNPGCDILYVSDDGVISVANSIKIFRNKHLIDEIYVEPTRNIREQCNFIEATIRNLPDGISSEITISEDQKIEVLEELKRRGITDGKILRYDGIVPENITTYVESVFTKNHFRLIVSIALKAMIFLGYSKSLLKNMIEYVDNYDDELKNNERFSRCKKGVGQLFKVPITSVRHEFRWDINQTTIKISAKILTYDQDTGFILEVSIPAGDDSSIIVPFGSVCVQYGNNNKDGKIELFKGNTKTGA